jgi:hypothetical protein
MSTIYHKHHIIPKHMGGSDDPSNLIELTVEEHAEAHRKLFEEYGHWQDELAWKGLAGIIGKEEIVHRLSASNGFLGKKHSEEWKIAQSKIMSGRKISEEHKNKISQSKKGKILSEETKNKLRIASMGNTRRLGKKHSQETKKKMSESRKKFLRS